MQHIQDNDLDKLFRSKFEDATIEPSRELWKDIEQQLKPEKKPVLPVFWLAAASVALVLSFTMFFTAEEKVQLQGATNVTVPVEEALVFTVERPVAQVVDFKPAQTVEEFERAREEKLRGMALQNAVLRQEMPFQTSPDISAEHKPEASIQEVLPVKKVPVYIASVDYDNVTSEIVNDDMDKRKGIRNVGDLVNFVVDKVDKREKKAIRFKTNDDESSIVGVNIGFLKFNKKDK